MNPTKNQTIFTTSQIILPAAAFLLWASVLHAQLPHFKKNEHRAMLLMVHGKPFLMIAGKASAALMKHVVAVDSQRNKIVAMQIENEVGTLGSEPAMFKFKVLLYDR